LASETKLFFVDCVRNFGSLSKEIKIFANRLLGCGSCWLTTTKGIIVEDIVFLI